MKLSFVFLCCLLTTTAHAQQESYAVPIEAKVNPDVPQGKIHGPFEHRSRIFPGTVRNYWVYVPANYSATQPPCLMVVQDGLNRARGWKLPTVLDNMIHAGTIPSQLGIFVSPGVVPAASDKTEARYNRSFEYDSMGDRYSRFLLEELLPKVAERWTFSDDPNDRCIAGSSSGAVCAFTVAWERPDEFRRVFSTIGTYVGLRGANDYPTLVRKTEPKPLRIFLQDGSNDLDIYAGGWWTANLSFLSALQFSGYDVRHVWGKGGHNAKHGAAILPEALAWLWKDHPEPIRNLGGKPRRADILMAKEDWEIVTDTTEPARLATPTEILLPNQTQYVTGDSNNHTIEYVDSTGQRSTVAKLGSPIVGLAVSPDKSRLTVATKFGRYLVSFRISQNGRLKHRQRYGWLHLPDDLKSQTGGMAVDSDGFTYIPTTMGIQVIDQLGRVNLIIRSPDTNRIESVAFGGPNNQVLFAKVGQRTYQRKLKRRGVPPEASAIKPPKPGL